ncbi:hypothetical protein [Mycobacterium bourgelatii]|uniref:MarR family transcriptional regulator n=1 Tax=Mycobacterium bourgelatii TaxID=1273442 RepID=A0A7I9YQH6_MYCBU|nr:hypothetical protein MBOU_29710 [Mycobacterium bourgelatii]
MALHLDAGRQWAPPDGYLGRAAIEMAAPGHVEDVRRNFIDLFTPAELDVLAALNERVLHHLAEIDRPAKGKPS